MPVENASAPASSALARLIAGADRTLARFPTSLSLLVLRVTLALPFWRSGLTKWGDGLSLSDSAVYLFTEEFKLHLFGATYAYPFPEIVAYLSAMGEIALPVLLVVGLGTRFTALGLLAMTAVIQLTVPEGWMNFHLPWAAMALTIMTFGSGRLALDHLIASLRESRQGETAQIARP